MFARVTTSLHLSLSLSPLDLKGTANLEFISGIALEDYMMPMFKEDHWRQMMLN